MLETKNFSLYYQDMAILQDINIRIDPGKITALIGHNGSGKTLLMMALLGHLPHDFYAKGIINFHGKKMGLIPQKLTYLNPLKTVAEHIKRKCFLEGIRTLDIDLLLKEYLLPVKAKVLYPQQLSAGMVKKVFCLLAFIGNPDFIIADELTANIDLPSKEYILNFLKEKAYSDKKSILLITHDMEIVEKYAEKVYLIHNRKISNPYEIDSASHKDFKKYYSSLPPVKVLFGVPELYYA